MSTTNAPATAAAANSTQQPPQQGIVKQVQSGDSVVIRGMPKGGPPPEKQINLAFVIAPKMGRKMPDGQFTNDEPWAWEARELLRKKLVGKNVQFRCEYKINIGNAPREFGWVFLKDENIVETMVNEGLAEVVRKNQNKDLPEYGRLLELEEAAKVANKGKWSREPAERRQVIQDIDDPQKLINKTWAGIVEHVRDGSTLRIALEIEPKKKYQMATVMLAGVRSPPVNDAHGDEARFFTESRLLQKDVTVRVESTSGGQSPALVGSVMYGQLNISEYLVKDGLARCVDWTLASAKDPAKLRKLEKEAKSKKLRIWKDYKDPSGGLSAAGGAGGTSFEARVVEIVNGDALMVQDNKNQVKKVFISSIRPPRLDQDKKPPPQPTSDDKKAPFRPLYDVPFLFEAREYLRKRLIGKKVKIIVDYIQPKTEQFLEKNCCTVMDGDVNIGEALVSRGLASVVRYRPDDEARSHCYDQLLAAEMKAQKNGKGLFGNSKDAGVVRIVDLSTNQAKAKQFQPFLMRTSNVRRDASVEFIYSASRIKLFVPKENCLLNLILAGVSTPKVNEPGGQPAAQLVKSLIHQRDVQVQIDGMDKVGSNFIGWVYFDDGKKNLAMELIKSGMASVRDYKYTDLVTAEAEAKKKKIGLWEHFTEEEEPKPKNEDDGPEDEATEKNGEGPALPADDLDKRKKIVVTNTSMDMTTIHGQLVDDGPKLEELLAEMRQELTDRPPLPGAYQPKKGDLVAGRFSADGQWYRAKIEKLLPQSQVQVLYVDYGNRETIPNRELAPLPVGSSGPAPAAKEYSLAFVRVPGGDPEYVEEARNAFLDETQDRILLLKSEYRDANGLDAVTLIDEQSKKDVVMGFVAEGLFLVDVKGRREKRLQKMVNDYKNAQETARKDRKNLWRYGDFTEDDAKEFGYPTN